MPWLVDGVPLSTLAFNVSNRAAGWKVPAKRGENLSIPGRNGTQWVPNKPFDQGRVDLSMWAVGAKEDGSLPDPGSSAAILCRSNLDKLTALFGTSHRLLEVLQVSSTVFGATNEIKNPRFERAQPGVVTEQYRNLLTNPGGRKSNTTHEQYRNLFQNPELVGEDWSIYAENLFTDPMHKKYRSSTPNAYGEQNLFIAPSFDSGHSFPTGVALHTTAWFTGAPSGVACTVEAASMWGNQSVRLNVTAAKAAGTILGQFRPMSVPTGARPSFRMLIRGASGTATTKQLGYRLVFYGPNSGELLFTGPWKDVTNQSTGTPWVVGQTWPEIAAVNPNAMDGVTRICVEFRCTNAWASGDGFVMDEFTLTPGATFSTTGEVIRYSPNPTLLPPRIWGDFTPTVWTGTAGQSISQYRTVDDPRWEPMATLLDGTPSAATAAGVNLLTSDPSGTSCGFWAVGPTTTPMAQAYRRKCARVVAGEKYWTRIRWRGASSAGIRFSLCSSTDGGTTLTERVWADVTGSGAASGQGLSGTLENVHLDGYVPQAGEELYVVVTAGVTTEFQMRVQITAIGVSAWWGSDHSGDTTDTANTRYAWAGDQYDSITEIRKRSLPQFANRNAITETRGNRYIESFGNSSGDDDVAGAVLLPDFPVTDRMRSSGVRVSAFAYKTILRQADDGDQGWVAIEVTELGAEDEVLAVHVGPRTTMLAEIGEWLVSISVPELSAETEEVRVRFHLQDPAPGDLLFLRRILVADVGAPVDYISGSMGGTWAGTPNASESRKLIPFPESWSVPKGLAQNIPMSGDGCAQASAVGNRPVVVEHTKAVSSGTYQVGAAVATLTSAEVTAQAVNGEQVLSETYLGSVGEVSNLTQNTHLQTMLTFPTPGTGVRFKVNPLGVTSETLETSAVTGRVNLAANSSFTDIPAYMTSGGGATVALSEDWVYDGDTSLRVDPSPGNNSSAVYPHGVLGFDYAGFAPGETYTVSAYIRLAATQTGTLSESARRITIGVAYADSTPVDHLFAQSAAAPNTAGVHRVSVTFTLPSTNLSGAFIRLMNGAPNTAVWWDGLMVERGTELRDWIEVATPGATVYAQGVVGAYNQTSLVAVPDGIRVQWSAEQNSAGVNWVLKNPIPAGARFTVHATVQSDDQITPCQIRMWAVGQPLPLEAGMPVAGESQYRLTQQAVSEISQVRFYITQVVGGRRIQPDSYTITDLHIEWSLSSDLDVCVEEAYLFESSTSNLPKIEANRIVNPDFRGTYGWLDERPPQVVRTNPLTSLTGTGRGGSATLTPDPPYGTRVRATGANTSAVYPWGPLDVLTPGKTYTVSATIRLTAAQTGPLHPYAPRAISVGWATNATDVSARLMSAVSPSAPNVPGTYRLSVRFTVPAGQVVNRIRLLNGAQTGDVWWSDVTVAEHYPLELVSTPFGPALHGELTVNEAALPAVPLHVRAGVRSKDPGSVVQIRWYDANGVDLGTSPVGTPEGSTRVEVAGSVEPLPGAARGRFEAQDSGGGLWLYAAYVAPILPSRNYDPGTDLFKWRYFDGSSTSDSFGFPTVWDGVADQSESVANSVGVAGWLAPVPWKLIRDPDYRPPDSRGSVGALGAVEKGVSVTAASVPVPSTGLFVSGQISLRKTRVDTGVMVEVVGYTDVTGSGPTVLWSKEMEEVSEVIRWQDVPIHWSHVGLVVTYTERSEEPPAGWALYADNLLMMTHEKALETEYPGYFDGSTSGGQWTGEEDNSVSMYYGGGRRCYAEVVEAVDMASMTGGTRAEFVAAMNIPASFWEDLIEVTITEEVTNEQMLTGFALPLRQLAGTTAPIDDAVITVDLIGSAQNLTLGDMASGAQVHITGEAPATLTVDNKAFTVRSGGVSYVAKMTRSGNSNQLLPLTPPGFEQAPQLWVKADSGSATMTVTVKARRRYFIA